MEPFRFHVFVCDQQKAEGVPCCAARGSRRVLEALVREVASRGLEDEVQVTACGSLGLCEHGPNVVVYPEGVWYSGVKPEDVAEIVHSHFEEDAPVERLARTDVADLRAEILSNREKMRAARRTREAAGVLPDDLNDRIRGFQESRIILTALELDLFTAIGAGGSAAEAASRMGTDSRATEMLLNALAAMGLLAKHDGTFTNMPVSERYFHAQSQWSVRQGLLHTAHLWRPWSTLTECVRAGTAVAREDMGGAESTAAFIAAMHHNATERAPLVVRAVGPDNVRRMLDVGGGSGAYSIAFARANPELRADILDLAPVTAIARKHIEEAGLAERIRLRAGDLTKEDLGEGYDLVFVSAICHMLSPEENRDLLRRAWRGLARGGRIVIQDFILEPDKTSPKFAALFAINMLTNTRAGSSYSEPEYAAWLEEAGFREIRRIRFPGPTDLMMAVRT